MKAFVTQASGAIRSAAALGALAVIGCLTFATARAADPGAESRGAAPGVEARAMGAEGRAEGASPQAAMRAFLTACREGDFEEASRYLDLRGIPPAERRQTGANLAWRLKSVLDRRAWVDVDALSTAPEGDREDGLPPNVEHVASLDLGGRTTPIVLVRFRHAVDTPAWQISSATLTALQPLIEQIPWVEAHLPGFLTRPTFLEVTPWQWIALPALVLLSMVLGTLLTRMLRGPVKRLATSIWSDAGELVDGTRAPLRLLATAGCFLGLLPSLLLDVPAHAVVRKLALGLVALGFIWLAARCLDEVGRRMTVRMMEEDRLDAAGLVRPGARIAKLLLAVVVFVVLAQNFGLDVTGVLAGLGVGGLAVALAAQKTVENLFGGITLVADRPVQVGDFCRFGDRVGTIEEIGLRSTRIRTLDRTLVTVPNAQFPALQLENYAQRDRIWLKLVLGLRYETSADQLRGVLAALRQMLFDHPRVDPDPVHVRFLDYGAYSLDVELFAYVRTNDYEDYLAVREEILLSIMDIVEEHGTGFAFPSQTIYTARDGGIDPGRAAASDPGVRIGARSV